MDGSKPEQHRFFAAVTHRRAPRSAGGGSSPGVQPRAVGRHRSQGDGPPAPRSVPGAETSSPGRGVSHSHGRKPATAPWPGFSGVTRWTPPEERQSGWLTDEETRAPLQTGLRFTGGGPYLDASTGRFLSPTGALNGYTKGTGSPFSAGSADAALDAVQAALDAAGLVPGLGEGADLLSGLILLGRGDYEGAGLSLASVLPLGGQVAGTVKLGRRAGVDIRPR